jgi:hypothetical protein
MSPPKRGAPTERDPAPTRTDGTGVPLLAERYEVRDQWGKRRGTLGREEAAAGIRLGCFKPIGRTCAKYMMVVRSDGGGDLLSHDASLTTQGRKESTEHIQRRCEAYARPATPIQDQRHDFAAGLFPLGVDR